MPTDDEWAEADILADETHGKPLKRPAAEGIRDMEALIISLRGRLDSLHPAARNTDAELQLIREIREAEARLKEYQIQIQGRN